jgi:hypothetical protein
MTVTLDSIHKAAVLKWHQHAPVPGNHSDWTIVGREASISVDLKDGTEVEKRTVPNTGTANLFFPLDYTGEVHVVIRGSKSGVEEATLSIA